MTQLKLCPECGSELPENTLEGLCPKCLLHCGLDSANGKPDGEAAMNQAGFIPPPPHELAKHFPSFEIIELLGQGGMGAVYKARHQKLDRLVALKVLPTTASQDPAFAERFLREARALAKLSHPHIVGVHDFGEVEGLYYFVMEFVDGVNLRQLMEAEKLSPAEALKIVPQICEALQYAHDEGIVHRDIKPENILLDRRGRVKIADFGLAKLLGRTPADLTLTGTRQVMGTPHYMAPEQMEKPHAVDHRADIYSLGVVFYEILTGELPLGRFAPPSQKVQVDVRLDEVVLRALEKEPERRYQHASEVKTDVDGIVANGLSQSDLAYMPAGRQHPSQSFPIMKWPLATIAACLVVIVTSFMPWASVEFTRTSNDFPSHLRGHFPQYGREASAWESYLPLGPIRIPTFLTVFAALAVTALSVFRELGAYSGKWWLRGLAFYGLCHTGVVAIIVGSEYHVQLEAAPLISLAAFLVIFVCTLRSPAFIGDSLRHPLPIERTVADLEKAQRLVRGPATGLIIAAVVSWFALSSMNLGIATIFIGENVPISPNVALFVTSLLFIPLVAMFIGARKMDRLESYAWAKASSVLAMIPWTPAWFITWPLGIWAYTVLSRQDVEAAFRRGEGAGTAKFPKNTGPIQREIGALVNAARNLFVGSVVEKEPSTVSHSAVAVPKSTPRFEPTSKLRADVIVWISVIALVIITSILSIIR